MSKQLNEPITDSGIRNTNFFNGRLLTARDLQTDQQAERSKRWQLGRAIGDGVVEGFEVILQTAGDRTTLPVVGVKKGLAINRKGQVLSLPNDDEVTLIRRIELPPPEAGAFGDCGLPTSTFTNLDRGVYLFVVGPASTFRERAPMRSVEPNNAVSGCGSKYAVEGVQFDLIKLEFSRMDSVSDATRTQIATLMSMNDPAAISKLRNIAAHICFDSEEATPRRRDPFKRVAGEAGYVNYGGLAALRRLAQLTDCQVPLALIYWSGSGVAFVDNWAARRLARRMLDLDVLSILRSYGYERLLQFQEQLQDLFDRLGGLAAVQIQNYFQYLPAVGYFPVTGVKSPRGFHPTTFFRQLTTGPVGVITTERFGALLRESFACPDIDLQTRPLFQVFRVEDNETAVNANQATRLFHVFVTRELNGPVTRDGVTRTFSDAWDVYRGLIKRRIFLPAATDEITIVAHHTITTAIREVLDIANRQAALAGAGVLHKSAALDAFLEIHRVQNDLATLFQSNIPGIFDTQQREAFARSLAQFLNTAIPGKQALNPAITARDLVAAVNAQDHINQFVGSWSGEGVAVGPFGATWSSSPEGQDLVPGREEPFPQHFIVTNSTDRRLRLNLEARITPPAHGDWTGSTRIENLAHEEISSVDLPSSGHTTIVVQVKAPADAQVGEQATLTVTTEAPPPTNRSTSATLTLRVASTGGGAVTSRVTFDGPIQTPTADMDNAAPNTVFSYFYNLLYSAPAGSPATRFLFTVNLSSTAVGEWRLAFQDLDEPENPSPGVFTREVQLTPLVPRQLELMILTPARSASDKTASFIVNVTSLDLSPEISVEQPQAFTIRVRPREG